MFAVYVTVVCVIACGVDPRKNSPCSARADGDPKKERSKERKKERKKDRSRVSEREAVVLNILLKVVKLRQKPHLQIL